MVLGGCASAPAQVSSGKQNTNTEPQQDQQQTGSDDILQPPALPDE